MRLTTSNIITGRQLRAARILAGLTQKQLAQEVGVARMRALPAADVLQRLQERGQNAKHG